MRVLKLFSCCVLGRENHFIPLALERAGDPVGTYHAISRMLLQPLDALLRRRDDLLQRTDPRLDLGDGAFEALFT